MSNLPTGTVTFLFTDIEGSTERWERDRAAMQAALDRHNAILSGAIEAHGGVVFKTVGDAYCAAFSDATSALEAAIEAQRALHTERFQLGPDNEPLRVRMGIHTGLVELKDGDYFGRPVNRVARLMSAGHGGQILVSLATQQLVRDALPKGSEFLDLGVHRLRDLEHTEHIFRLFAPGMPDDETPPDTAERLRASERAPLKGVVADAECPYRGLHAFREEDARFFFGREVFTDLLGESLAAAPMLGVVGPSGSGKSSVVHAGLVPRLRAGALGTNGEGNWTVASLRPGSRPFHSLAGVLVPLLEPEMSRTDRLVETGKMAEALARRQVRLHEVVGMIREAQPDLGRLFLIADQFEELYTLCPDEDVQRGFQDLLFNAAFGANGAGPALHLALTLRADFMGHALAYRPFADAMQKHDVKLGPMNREELARVIASPAELQGRAFEPGLVDRIAEDVGEKAGALPLLEFALTKLWDEQEAGWLTHEAYERIGRVEGAVARHADAVYEQLEEKQQEDAHRIFVQLVQPGEGTEDTRRLATHQELEDVWDLVRRLADDRLVTTGRDTDGHQTAEVVHEALIRSWGRLVGWMKEDRLFRMWQERLRFALRQWEDTGRDDGALLRGVPLAEAERWLEERGEELAGGEQGYVRSSLEARDRRRVEREAQRERELEQAQKLIQEQTLRAEEQELNSLALKRRAVWLVGALAVAGVLAVLAVAAGWRASRSAETAESNAATSRALKLAANAEALISQERYDTSLALALEAVAEAGSDVPPEVEVALSEAAYAPGAKRVIEVDSYPASLAFTPDGVLLSGHEDGTIRKWDIAEGTEIGRLQAHDTRVSSLAISPDGATLASGSKDAVSASPSTALKLWDLASDRLIGSLEGHESSIVDLEFSPDGSRLASSGYTDGTVRIWDLESMSEELVLDGDQGGVRGIAFTPDGFRIASAGSDRTILLWDLSTGEVDSVFEGHRAGVWGLAISPDGNRVVSGADAGDSDVWLRDLSTGEVLVRARGHVDAPQAIRFSDDGSYIVTGAQSPGIFIWDAQTGAKLRLFTGHSAGTSDVAISPDQTILASSSSDDTIRFWHLESPAQAEAVQVDAFWRASAADFADEGGLLTGSDLGVLQLWDQAGELRTEVRVGTNNRVYTVIDFPQLDAFFANYTYGIGLFGKERGDPVWLNSNPWTDRSNVILSSDGRLLLRQSGTAKLVVENAADGARLKTIGIPSKPVAAALSPDGRLVAMGNCYDPREVLIVDLSEERVVSSMLGHSSCVAGVAWSPDGRQIASVAWDQRLHLWDAISGESIDVVTFDAALRQVTYNPDGRSLLIGSASGEVFLWDIARRATIRRYAAHDGAVERLRISRDGTTSVSAGGDLKVRKWLVHPSLNDLIPWIQEKRFVAELSCEDRVRFGTAAQCDAESRSPPPIMDRLSRYFESGGPIASASKEASMPVSAAPVSATPEPRPKGDAQLGEQVGAVIDGSGEVWRFEGRAGAIVRLSARADSPADGVLDPTEQVARALLDTVLVVRAPNDAVVARSEARLGGVETDAEIKDLELTTDGTYSIEVHSYQGLTSGSYSLVIDEVTALPPLAKSVPLKSYVNDLVWHPDTRHVLGALSDGSIRVVDMDTGDEVRRLIGHTSAVYSIAVTSDGETAISSGADKAIVWWDLTTGSVIQRITPDEGTRGAARRVRLSQDETKLLTGHRDGIVRLLDARSGEVIREYEGHRGNLAIWSVAFSPDGRFVLSGSADAVNGDYESAVLMWDIETGEVVRRFEGHVLRANDVAFSPDGSMIVSGGQDRQLILWDAMTGEEIRRLGSPAGPINNVGFSIDGRLVLSFGYDDASVRVFDIDSGNEVARGTGLRVRGRGLSLSPRGTVAAGDSFGRVIAWDASMILGAHHGTAEMVGGSLFSGRAAPVASSDTVGSEGRSEILDALASITWQFQAMSDRSSYIGLAFEAEDEEGDDESLDVRLRIEQPSSALTLDVALDASEDDSYVLGLPASTVSSTTGIEIISESERPVSYTLAITETVQIAPARTIRPEALTSVPSRRLGLYGMALMPDGRQIIAGLGDRTEFGNGDRASLRDDNRIGIWDIDSGRHVRWLNEDTSAHRGLVQAIAVSPDGRQMLSGSEAAELVLWDLETYEVERRLVGHTGQIWSISFAPDNTKALSAALDGSAILWDLSSGTLIHRLEHESSPYVYGSALSPDGLLGATGLGGGEITMWDLESGESKWRTQGHDSNVHQMAFTPDGQQLVSLSASGDMAIWSAGTGEEVDRVTLPGGYHFSLAISPDGHWALTGPWSQSRDNATVWLWDFRDRKIVAKLAGATDGVLEVAFTPDGGSAVGTSHDGGIRIWTLTQVIEAATEP